MNDEPIELTQTFEDYGDGWYIKNGRIFARYICPSCETHIWVNDDWPRDAECRCRTYELEVVVRLG